jgi:hypothetical protein
MKCRSNLDSPTGSLARAAAQASGLYPLGSEMPSGGHGTAEVLAPHARCLDDPTAAYSMTVVSQCFGSKVPRRLQQHPKTYLVKSPELPASVIRSY